VEDVAMFMFVASAVTALFAFLSIASWAGIRAQERKTIERYALLRKIADGPTESARLVLDMMREEDARSAVRQRRREKKARRDALMAGTVVTAVGVALGIMLAAVSPEDATWTVGLIPTAVGVVVTAFAYFGRPQESDTPEAGV
jgi:hypothetical protein